MKGQLLDFVTSVSLVLFQLGEKRHDNSQAQSYGFIQREDETEEE
jgi:hypothetical protein